MARGGSAVEGYGNGGIWSTGGASSEETMNSERRTDG